MNASTCCGGRATIAALAAILTAMWSFPAAARKAADPGGAGFEYVVQTGHTGTIKGLAYAPNGRFFASGGKDSKIRLWAPNGTLIRTIPTALWVTEMAISHDSRTILAAWRIGTIRLLSLEGEVLRKLPRPSPELGLIESVALSPDGRYAAIGTTARRILIYSLAAKAGEAAPVLLEAPGEEAWGVEDLLFTPDGRIISAHADGKVRFWDVQARNLEKTLDAHEHGVYALALSPDGKTLATGGRLYSRKADAEERARVSIRLWDLDGRPLAQFPAHGTSSLHFTPDGKQLVSGGYFDGEVHFYTRSGERVRTVTVGLGNFNSPRRIALSPDGKILVTADEVVSPPGLKLWTADGRFVRNLQTLSGSMTNVAVSPDGQHIVTLSGDGRVRVWSPTGRLLGNLEAHESYSTGLAYAPNGQYFASGGESVILWSHGGQQLGAVEGFPNNAGSVAFTADSRYLLCGDGTGFVTIFDLESDEIIRFQAHDGRVEALATDPTGRLFATGTSRWQVRIWDMAGNLRGEYDPHPVGMASSAFALDFFPDGQRLIFATGGDRGLQILDLEGKPLGTIEMPSHAHYGDVKISPSGQLIAATVNDDIAVWDAQTHELMRVLRGHTGNVTAIDFLGAGNHLVSVAQDSSTRIWRLQDRYAMTLLSHGDEWLMYSSDGYFDASHYGGDLVAMVRGMEVFSVDQFALRMNRPDLILSRLGLGSERYIEHLRALYQRRLERSGVQEEAGFGLDAPEVRISKAVQDGKFARIEAELVSESRPLRSYQVYVNHVPLFPGQGKPLSGREAQISERVELVHGKNVVEIGAFDDRGAEALRARWSAVYRAPVDSDLYFIGFGVSHYRNPDLNLQFAHKDVLDLAKVLQRYEGAFDDVIVETYIDEAVTQENIEKAGRMLRGADTDDTVVVLVSGHGAYDPAAAAWYYATWNVDFDRLAATAASFDQLESLLSGIAPRRKLMLLDACESGAMDAATRADIAARMREAGLDARTSQAIVEARRDDPRPVFVYDRDRYIYNDLSRRTGAVIFSASHAGEMSFESTTIENGFFTQQIIDALGAPQADTDHDGMIAMDELQAYVSLNVGLQTAGLQRPTIDRDNISQRLAFPLLN